MTPAISTILIILAVVGALSGGTWITLAVQYLTKEPVKEIEDPELALLRGRLQELQVHNESLRSHIDTLQRELNDINTLIVEKLISK